ncbi:metallophosphoesterase [Myxococcota bacterium]|nr:metallophosphoesterase [Myxococcota bacterium]
MKLWKRLFSKEEPPPTDGEERLLVISDIHLGEDILDGGPENLSENIRILNHHLAAFVAWHRQNRSENRQWHLVINGDMFDFVKASLHPEAKEAYTAWSTQNPDDSSSDSSTSKSDQPPPAHSEEMVVWKLKRIIEIHRPLFRDLALFIADGNKLTMIEGNHDAEFYYGDVRDTLTDSMLEMAKKEYKREHRSDSFDAEGFRSRVDFKAWFLAEPGIYHIEHGHQYDEFCSFEYNLAPCEAPGTNTIAIPMVQKTMPYFADIFGDFSTHGMEEWTLTRWGKFVFSFGPRLTFAILVAYLAVIRDLLMHAGKGRRQALLGLRKEHRKRLKALAHNSTYGLKTIQALDRLKATPAEYSFATMMNTFYLDRLALGASLIFILPLSLFLIPTPLAFMIVGGEVLISGFLFWLSGKLNKKHLPEKLRKSAAEIAKITGARFVIFGHSHEVEVVDLVKKYQLAHFGQTSHYLNSGSWVTREILLGEEGEGMTYLELGSDGAIVKRWCGKNNEIKTLEKIHSSTK